MNRTPWPRPLLAGLVTRLILLGSLFAVPSTGVWAAPAPGEAEPTWVFFRDRGPAAMDPAESARLAESYPREAWARRLRAGKAVLPDEQDRPLWPPYVSQVAALGRLRVRSRWLNAVSALLSPAARERARGLPFVDHLQPVAVGRVQGLGPALDALGRPLETTIGAAKSIQSGPAPYGPAYGQLQEIRVPALHTLGYTGNRVLMMMIDTGFRKDHHAFAHTRILAERDFVFHDGNTQNQPGDDPYQQSHGTGTWAVAGGYDPGRIVGPAYGATFVLSKTEDIRSETRVEEDNYVAALEWADSLGVQLTSASLGYTCFDDGFCYTAPMMDGRTAVISRAVDLAASRGILCVNAAGNWGNAPSSLGTPADADSMIAVGAVDSLDQIASFSSRGPTYDGRIKPEVVARGLYTWWADAGAVDGYGFASGTSLSTPLAAGACALLLEAHPEWSNLQLREALLATADRSGAPDNDYGWGRINLPAALNYTPVVYPTPFSLLVPADSATVPGTTPSFAWRASRDPDHPAAAPSYSLHLWDPASGGSEWNLDAGADTTFTLPFELPVGQACRWEVEARDGDGHVRLSRERRSFNILGPAGVAQTMPRARGLEVVLGPNPFSGSISFRARAASAAVSSYSWIVTDAAGSRVASARGAAPHGECAGWWDGRGPDGRAVVRGVYFLEITLGRESARRALVRLGGDVRG